MRYFLAAIVLIVSQTLFADNFEDYRNHIAKDRLILFFQHTVSDAEKEAIIYSSGLVNHFVHIESPDLTICFVTGFDAAQKFFFSVPEVRFVSFFITDGKNYAGVLDEFFVKLQGKTSELLLLEKLREVNLGVVNADKYIPDLYKISNSKFASNNTVDVCKKFLDENWVEYAVPNYLLNPLVTSNDQYYFRQWNIANTGSSAQGNGTPDADMDVDSAWTITTGDSAIKVVIIDSGVDTLHVDLRQNILPGHDAIGDSTDGFPTPVFPNDGHGTCCAGIVGATKDNNFGVAGVAPSCKLIPVRAFYYVRLSPGAEPIPLSTAAAFSDAISWSWSVAEADILSNSWGLPASIIGILPGGTQPVDDAIQQAYTNARNGKGIAMFFSSGNDNDSIEGPIWPSKLPHTIAVNATTMCDERKSPNDCSGETWWGGNFGANLDFSAPGVKITTTDMRGNKGYNAAGDYYFAFNGTSAACPNAAAVGALLLSVRPDLSGEDIRTIIARTCDKTGGYSYDSVFTNGTWSRELGYGRVNANRAVQYAIGYSSLNETLITHWSIYPNPSSGMIQIQNEVESTVLMKIFDLAGNQLFEKILPPELSSADIAFLPAGMYIIRLETEKETATKKVAIVR